MRRAYWSLCRLEAAHARQKMAPPSSHVRPMAYGVDPEAITVIGAARDYVVQKDDTLLDIARNFDLGFSEIQVPYKDIDP